LIGPVAGSSERGASDVTMPSARAVSHFARLWITFGLKKTPAKPQLKACTPGSVRRL
jgi:hypothetical protein